MSSVVEGICTIDQLPANKLVPLYLMSSYLYYVRNQTPIPDVQYDEICKQLLLKYKDVTHRHKHLVSEESLRAGTAYHLQASDYPLMVQGASHAWVEKGCPIICGFTSRRRRRPVQAPPIGEEAVPVRRRRRRI